MGKESRLDVAIVGAGPYGIALGLFLGARGVSYRVFGPPMRTWIETMPKGMDLKSEGYASTIGDPTGKTLETYCAEHGHAYKAVALPVPLSVFQSYGLEAHARLGGNADRRLVSSVVADGSEFRIGLEDGAEFSAKRVVIAAGITHFAQVPEQFQETASELLTHSSAHWDTEPFRGKELIVVGAGASAIDLAVLAAEAGASVTMVCRGGIKWNEKRLDPRPLYERIRLPESCMGPGVRSCLYEKFPLVFKKLPPATRDKIAKEFAGPSGGWAVHERFDKAVTSMSGTSVESFKEVGGRLEVKLTDADGGSTTRTADHLVCATGYKTDVNRFHFIDQKLRNQLARINGSPVLGDNFESSVPGMFFVGKAAAVTFGPLMRFVCGTEYAAKRLSRFIAA